MTRDNRRRGRLLLFTHAFVFLLLQIGPMNIGNPTEFTIKELAEMTVRLTKSTSKIIYKPLPQVPPLTSFSSYSIKHLSRR